MSCHVQIAHFVRVRRELRAVHAVELAYEGHEARARLREIIARGVQLRAVAGRQHDCLARRAAFGQRPQRSIDTARLEVEALAQLNPRGAMAESNEEEMHQKL